MPSERTPLFILVTATIILWGLWGFFGKLALDKGMSPLSIFIFEILASFICAAIVIGVFRITPNPPNAINLRAWNIYGVVSGVTLALGLLFYYLALYRGQASIIVPLTAAYPVVTAILSITVLREHLSPLQWIGIVLVAVGVVLLLLSPHSIEHTSIQIPPPIASGS